ncbi:hypothetical protein [Burkholderia sp. BCC0397]|uniref:DedA family protein n=1 Tax=Burkholderia sp. BCC0397 TaxID=486876 RepID=UPI001FC86A39|nr:hypothetical protein [Burkholderia sp. BCC0397]
MHAWLVGIATHPALVLIVVFSVACAESLAIVGTLVPAGIVMFAAGASIGAGVLEVWVTLAVAALGAMTGDGVSFEVGRRYAGEVRTWWAEKGQVEPVWLKSGVGARYKFVQNLGTNLCKPTPDGGQATGIYVILRRPSYVVVRL